MWPSSLFYKGFACFVREHSYGDAIAKKKAMFHLLLGTYVKTIRKKYNSCLMLLAQRVIRCHESCQQPGSQDRHCDDCPQYPSVSMKLVRQGKKVTDLRLLRLEKRHDGMYNECKSEFPHNSFQLLKSLITCTQNKPVVDKNAVTLPASHLT